MTPVHPLDRPAWSALTGRQSAVAVAEGLARRYAPDHGLFAAVPAWSEESLADLSRLVQAHGPVALLQADEAPPPKGTTLTSRALGWQMISVEAPDAPPPGFAITPLTEADAAEMLALATLTAPGPYFARTHRLGSFVGVKEDGRLVAMAGERMKPDGHTEVSGVCTHPDRRGRGYAAGLMRHVAAAIRARGEVPFLHVYAANTVAIALYQSLGYVLRREVVMTGLAPQG